MYQIIEINVLKADVLNALLFIFMLQQIFILNGHSSIFVAVWTSFLLHRGAAQKSVSIFDLLLLSYVKCYVDKYIFM
jgi:hypothetical protein